jgi:hypothetical protein
MLKGDSSGLRFRWAVLASGIHESMTFADEVDVHQKFQPTHMPKG